MSGDTGSGVQGKRDLGAESVDVVFQATGLDEIEGRESVAGDGGRGPEEMRERRGEERGRRGRAERGSLCGQDPAGLCIPSTDLSWCVSCVGPQRADGGSSTCPESRGAQPWTAGKLAIRARV